MNETMLFMYIVINMQERLVGKYSKNQIIALMIDYHTLSNPIQRQNLSRWSKTNGNFSSDYGYIKKAVEEFLKLDKSIWTKMTVDQEKIIIEAIDNYKKHQSNNKVMDISDICIKNIIPNEPKMTQEQSDAIEKFKHNDSVNDIHKFIKNGWVSKASENQKFLYNLTFIIHQKGYYKEILGFILPAMMPKYRDSIKIKKIEADSMGIFNPEEALQIFEQLKGESTLQNINFKTSAISNMKRIYLKTHNKDKLKEYLLILVENYQMVYNANGIKSYYTGINLTYMIELGKMIFPKDKCFDIDTKLIYEESKESFKTDNSHNNYYVWMSQYEFQLLIGKNPTINIEFLLETEKPSAVVVERTIRQIETYFIGVAEKFGVQDNQKLKNFKTLLGILNDYLNLN